MKAISLVSKTPESPACAVPCSGPSEYKPSVYLSFPDDRLSELPASGTITFRYRAVSVSKNSRDGKVSGSVELELSEIVDAVPAKKLKETASVGEALAAFKNGDSSEDNDGDEKGE